MDTITLPLDYQEIGERMRAYRRRYHRSHGGDKMTQTALAERIGISKATVVQIEAGDGDSTKLATFDSIARALGIPLPTLLYGEQQVS